MRRSFFLFMLFTFSLVGRNLRADANIFAQALTDNIVQYQFFHRVDNDPLVYQDFYDRYYQINKESAAVKSMAAFTEDALTDNVFSQIVWPLQRRFSGVSWQMHLGHRAFLNIIARTMKFPLQYGQVYGATSVIIALPAQLVARHQVVYFNNYYSDGNSLVILLMRKLAKNSYLLQNSLEIPAGQRRLHLFYNYFGLVKSEQKSRHSFYAAASSGALLEDLLGIWRTELHGYVQVGMSLVGNKTTALYSLLLNFISPHPGGPAMGLGLFVENIPEVRYLYRTQSNSLRTGIRWNLAF